MTSDDEEEKSAIPNPWLESLVMNEGFESEHEDVIERAEEGLGRKLTSGERFLVTLTVGHRTEQNTRDRFGATNDFQIVETDDAPTRKSWIPYFGPYGGQGWYSPEWDEVRYQDEPPGAGEDAPASDFIKNFPCVIGADPFKLLIEHARENPIQLEEAERSVREYHENPVSADALWSWASARTGNTNIPEDVTPISEMPDAVDAAFNEMAMQVHGIVRGVDPTYDAHSGTVLVYRSAKEGPWADLLEHLEDGPVELSPADLPEEPLQSWTPDPLIASRYGGPIIAARLPAVDLIAASFLTDPERYDAAVEYIFEVHETPKALNVAAIHPSHGEDMGEVTRSEWAKHFTSTFCDEEHEAGLNLVQHADGGLYDPLNDRVLTKDDIIGHVVDHRYLLRKQEEPDPEMEMPEVPQGVEFEGPYCDDLGHCFDTPQQLGGHVAQTGHSISEPPEEMEELGLEDDFTPEEWAEADPDMDKYTLPTQVGEVEVWSPVPAPTTELRNVDSEDFHDPAMREDVATPNTYWGNMALVETPRGDRIFVKRAEPQDAVGAVTGAWAMDLLGAEAAYTNIVPEDQQQGAVEALGHLDDERPAFIASEDGGTSLEDMIAQSVRQGGEPEVPKEVRESVDPAQAARAIAARLIIGDGDGHEGNWAVNEEGLLVPIDMDFAGRVPLYDEGADRVLGENLLESLGEMGMMMDDFGVRLGDVADAMRSLNADDLLQSLPESNPEARTIRLHAEHLDDIADALIREV